MIFSATARKSKVKSGAGMGGVFSKVYLLRPKIKCNSPHSRPAAVPAAKERAPRESKVTCPRMGEKFLISSF